MGEAIKAENKGNCNVVNKLINKDLSLAKCGDCFVPQRWLCFARYESDPEEKRKPRGTLC
jgi:hypothetical protein